MLFVSNSDKSGSTTLSFPKTSSLLTSSNPKLTIWSEIDLKEYNYNTVDETSYSDYYTFTLNLDDFNTGEYRYLIKDDESTILESGMIYITDDSDKSSTFGKTIDKHEYTQYNG